jgi:hypothetical protein
MSCCRGKEKDPDLEFFELLDSAALAIANRPTVALLEDAKSNVRWSKYINLQNMLSNISQLTCKSLK